MNGNGTCIRSAMQKADFFAEYLEKAFQLFPRQVAAENIYSINERDYLKIIPVTIQELKNEFNSKVNEKKHQIAI